MNERIKELAEQATSIVEIGRPAGYTSSYANFDKEKFAELIVRECMFAVENHGGMCGVTSSKKIREHFGVEE